MNWLHYLREQIGIMRLRTRIFLYAIVLIVLCSSVYLLYSDYKKTIVSQQEQHMLSIAQSIARSIDLYIDEIENSIQILALNEDFVKSLATHEDTFAKSKLSLALKSYATAVGQPIYGAYLFDERGRNVVSQTSGYTVSTNLKQEVQTVVNNRLPYIGEAYLDPIKRNFVLNIYQPVFKNEALIGVFCVAIDLEVIYKNLIDPVKIGGKGYALVKDEDGIIIMHKLKEQIGYDVIDTRKLLYPNLDFSELEKLIDEQLKGQEGTMIFHSYWWADKDNLKKAKKISAYTPIDLGDHFWVVGLTMSYDEIQSPINVFLSGVIGLALFMALLFHMVLQALSKAKMTKDELEQETIYLKMLNESSEQLRQQESELYHSQKLKMIGTLAGGIAHDINNLLTPIYGYSELMLSQMEDDHPFKEEVDEIYKASTKGKDLIEQLLTFSRKDNGMTSISAVDINEVTQETIRLVRNILPKKIRITQDLEPDCGFIEANFTQIHQVIFNLCTNAYHAIEDETGDIHISLKKIPVSLINDSSNHNEEAFNFIEIAITDNGSGMTQETKERLFEPFFTTKGIGEGTGLGLFVVKSIIDKYGGQILVESAPGQGSTFKVYFQVKDKLACDTATHPKGGNLQGSGIRLLAVDDNDTVNRLLEKGLSYYGFEITTFNSSLQAYKAFKANPQQWDVLITDYMMPELKGTELARKARKVRKDVGIILMTGFMDESQASAASSKSIDAYILKPIQIATLADSIIKTYNRYRQLD